MRHLRDFIVLFAVIGVVVAVFFQLNRNAPLKRILWLFVMLGAGGLVGWFAWEFSGHQRQLLPIIALGVVLVAWTGIRTTRFCSACGRTLYGFGQTRYNLVNPTRFCPYCGAKQD